MLDNNTVYFLNNIIWTYCTCMYYVSEINEYYYYYYIDMCLVKKIIPYLVIPLEHIFYISLTSLQTGIFPDGMKTARVIPLFKNGNINDFTNYRPISLLSQFSKILEKIFHKRMMSFIEEKNILYESQYGFRKNMSTSLAMLELVENITTSIDDCKSTVGIFIDLKKAFDTVDHDILIKKTLSLWYKRCG